MTVSSRAEAWKAANKIFPTDYEKDEASSQRAGYDIYRHPTLNYYCRICDLGCRLEVLTGESGENVVNIWIVEERKPEPAKPAPHRAIVHYDEKHGNNQEQLQRLAADVLNYGKRVSECHHVSQEFHPDGTERTVPTGSYCVEALNEATGARYWVHFYGCRVTEIIEEYLKD